MIWLIIYLIGAYVTLAWLDYDEQEMYVRDSSTHIIGSLLWPFIIGFGIPVWIYWWIKGE
jgi:hypothetical protein